MARHVDAQAPLEVAAVTFCPIGVIRSEHWQPEKTPAQPVFAPACLGAVEIFPEYAAGLKDLAGCSHLYLIYHLDRAPQPQLIVKPSAGRALRARS
ncbi:MAG: TrmO family methyltransferase, partial [Burkholderiaceae bacterium]|nr:TrmO family methyltransferase [Burkholderiaceae bacterium]